MRWRGLVYDCTWFLFISISFDVTYINSYQNQGSASGEYRSNILQKPMFRLIILKVVSFLSTFLHSIENGDRSELINCLNLTGFQFLPELCRRLWIPPYFCFNVLRMCWLFSLSLTHLPTYKRNIVCHY